MAVEFLGYFLSVVMGFTLGLIGGGGSILTVPILVYVMAIDPILATAYSLFVVGSTSVAGTFQKFKQGFIRWRVAIIFALPSILAVFLTRLYLVPAIPAVVFELGDFVVTKSLAVMLFFAFVMIIASWSMIKNANIKELKPEAKSINIPLLLLEGLLVGVITGLVGAGGGFLIVPALVLLVGLPIKQAVGTSLLIIASKSLIGFLGDVGIGREMDWGFLILFTCFALVGMFIGNYITRFVDAAYLKKIFGWFVLLMAGFILLKETIL